MGRRKATNEHAHHHPVDGAEEGKVFSSLWVKGILEDGAEYTDESGQGIENDDPVVAALA